MADLPTGRFLELFLLTRGIISYGYTLLANCHNFHDPGCFDTAYTFFSTDREQFDSCRHTLLVLDPFSYYAPRIRNHLKTLAILRMIAIKFPD